VADSTQGRYIQAKAKASGGPQGDTHLLVIAIDDYAHCPPLHNCVKDARDLAQLLQDRYQVLPQHTYELYNKQATRKRVLRELKELRHKVGENDSLIVHFSGHGEVEDDEGYWIPVEGVPGEDEGWIAASSIKRRLNPINSFHTLVIADACFAGSFFISYKNATRQLLHSRRSRLGISASHSRERAFDGAVGDNSPFAKELLRALRHNQQPLPADQLFTQVRDGVFAATRGRQTPIFKNIDVKGDDQGQFVFVPAITEAQAWAACQNAGTVAAYEAFLAQFPNRRHHSEAKEMLRFLKEENAWQTARQDNSIASYLRYQDNYPQGRYFAQSVQAIADLEDAQDWATAQRRNTIAAYLQYQTRHPNGQYRSQAQQAVQRLRKEMTTLTPKPKPDAKTKTPEPQAKSKPYSPDPPLEKNAGNEPTPIPDLKEGGSINPYRQWALLGLLLVIFLTIGFSKGWFTGSGAQEVIKFSPSVKTGTVTLGGQTYRTVRLNGLTWLAENLNLEVDNSWCNGDTVANCGQYGRLYTWEAARLACKEIGWRLPTAEEWEEMGALFGGLDANSADNGRKAYADLTLGGASGMDILLGGQRYEDDTFKEPGERGVYWANTLHDSESATSYYFHGPDKEIYPVDNAPMEEGHSCRCVK